jgi:hypothetical protein
LTPTVPNLVPVNVFGGGVTAAAAFTESAEASGRSSHAHTQQQQHTLFGDHHSRAQITTERHLKAFVNEAIAAVHAAYEDLPLALRLLFAAEDSLMCLRSHSGAIECSSK